MSIPAVIRRPADAESRYGDRIKDWSAATDTPAMCWFSRITARESLDLREADVARWRCYFAAGTAISTADRVVIDGEEYEVSGPPNRARRPQGHHHVEVELLRVEG